MRVAAIDQGTTSTRVLVADTDGTIEIACAITHQQIHPHPGWVEHDPEELLGTFAPSPSCGRRRCDRHRQSGRGCLAWDARTGEALSPVIVWQDNRTADVIERLKAPAPKH